MLDWRILAASFAALLFISSVLVGGLGITDFFSTIANKISEWLGSTPFSNIFSSQSKTSSEEVDLTLYTPFFTLKPDSSVNITTEGITLKEFEGEVNIDFQNSGIFFRPINTQLTIDTVLKEVNISNLRLSKLLVDNTMLRIKSDKWNITSDNGSVEMHGFEGYASVTNSSITLKGNVSRLIY
jgi:hypothetical protein